MKNPFSFKGSIDRTKYFYTCIIAYTIVIVSVILIIAPLFNSCSVLKAAMYVFIVASQWAVIAASVRRLHGWGQAGPKEQV
ncbi:MAG: DUF805 domain-containing protein [Ignavibacteria bacterium]|jgi:uncharacterized membrane protein YhaH (DUF805 family)|nr:DUF805 domain-containing protein [Ignavibacteria bacterium]MCU7505089.1 DUF805 domain-containing protein [Ignavibacteria bacterium]MCU7518079.1 DUF805 domain-containing protein [Ignavibacteria bacterium]